MKNPRHWARLSAGAAIAAIFVYYASCSGALEIESGSEILAPVMQPQPADRSPTLGCSTSHPSTTRSWVDPVTGRSESRVYRSSAAVNFFQDGWENRVASSYQYLTEAHTGEPASRFRIVLINVRTVNGVAHYHYYGNAQPGNATHVNTVQPWSSSKVYGIAMAFHRMRFESNKEIGATATINGSTRIDEDMDYLNNVSSNKLAGFYKALAGRRLADDMIRTWVRRPGEAFAGFYGDNTYGSNQTFTFRAPSGASQDFTLRNDHFTGNWLSPLTLAEMIKRLGVGFKDASGLPKMVNYSANPSESEMRQADVSLKQEDLRVLFYGTNRGGLGGMMYDGLRDIPHNLGGSATLDRKTGGKWRAFGKGGSGYSGSRGKDEESTGDWVCLPGVNGGQGLEFALYAHIEGPNKVARLHAAISRTTKALFPEFWNSSGNPGSGDSFAAQCQPGSAKHQICSPCPITVVSDGGGEFPANPGEKICRRGETRNGGSEERVFFADAPRGYAWVPSPSQNICARR